MTLYLVVNLHGKINSPGPIRKALVEMKVERKFTATVLPDDLQTMGMLKLCKDYLAWCPVDPEMLTALLEKRGMATESRRLGDEDLAKLGVKKHKELAEKILKGNARLSSMDGIRPFFRLGPPKGGFKGSMRRQYSEKGILGSNPKLPEIVRRMV